MLPDAGLFVLALAPSFFALRPFQLLAAIADDDKEVSPSVLYAAAAMLEGCSFVNGGSQNTMCGALLKMAKVRSGWSRGAWCRGVREQLQSIIVQKDPLHAAALADT